jgi:acetyl/propionyl-CoA carboxylase alpha subunit
MFTKILIANRGEIALRVMRACHEMGIAAVAVYSEADRVALHVASADEAVCIGPAPATESYLNIERIIDAARQTGAQAIHPGYGFLAERAEFAQAARAAGLVFIGPSPAAIRALGSKTAARALMQAAGVPTVPGYQRDGSLVFNLPLGDAAVGQVENLPYKDDDDFHAAAARLGYPVAVGQVENLPYKDDDDLHAAAARLGYPVLVKAAAGGGGKGMRVAHDTHELSHALASARREAHNAFGDGSVYLEKLLVAPRHIEFQVLADQHGHTLHLLERECSVQRRHQKIIEETPSPLLDADLRARMGAAAVMAAQAVHYENAGTVEFLVDADKNFYFLEMNTRLQVEHPITEAVTGIDLVKAQIRIAAGEPLSFTQDDIRARGHALECRVYAEDPTNNFLPSIGKILLSDEPRGPGVRVDAGVDAGRDVTRFYDPMIAKVITHAETRAAAIARMERALSEYVILGVTTNIRFLRDALAHEVFRRGEATTHFVEEHFANWAPPPIAVPDEALIAAALIETTERPLVMEDASRDGHNPWLATDGFRMGRK